MDYHSAKIGSGSFLLPEVAKMDVIYRNGVESVNETRYSDCHEYVGESTIHFDDVDAGSASAAHAASAQPLPPKLRLRIGLLKPVAGETAAAGDEVEGVLLEDVRDKARGILARKDDRVRGRILRLEQRYYPQPKWTLELRFDQLERGGASQAVSLKPSIPDGVFTFAERGNLVLDRSFHSDWETR